MTLNGVMTTDARYLYVRYTAELSQICASHGLHHHMYADCQIYLNIRRGCSTSSQRVNYKCQCVTDVQRLAA